MIQSKLFLEVEPQSKLHAIPATFIWPWAHKPQSQNTQGNKPQGEGSRRKIIWHKIRFLIIRYRQWTPAGGEKAGNLIPWQVNGAQFGCLLKNLKNVHYLLFSNLVPCKFLPKKDQIWTWNDIHLVSFIIVKKKNLDILHIQEQGNK